MPAWIASCVAASHCQTGARRYGRWRLPVCWRFSLQRRRTHCDWVSSRAESKPIMCCAMAIGWKFIDRLRWIPWPRAGAGLAEADSSDQSLPSLELLPELPLESLLSLPLMSLSPFVSFTE